jgi:hypothetical protein
MRQDERSRAFGRRHRRALSVLAACAIASAAHASAASAALPTFGAAWVTNVSAGSVTFHGEVNPQGSETNYRFEYVTDQAFQEAGFANAAKAPASGAAPAGSGTGFVSVLQKVSALRAATLYHYRLSATNASGTESGAPLTFSTQRITGAFALPDARAFEMVSPPDKNGGAIQGPEEVHGGGVIQAAASGAGAITYSSSSSFGAYEAQGAPPASQYVSTRSESGWSTQNITALAVSGSYGNEPNGVPYQLFSPGLERGLMLNGVHCRGEGTGCPVANEPLPGSEAPEGFQDYYLRDSGSGAFSALMTQADSPSLTESSDWFNLALAGASPDLRHVVLSTCAKLTPEATETPGPEGCESGGRNLYEYAEGQLRLINFLPSGIHGTPGAYLAAQGGAVSEDGSRVYFGMLEDGFLFLREGSQSYAVSAGPASFQTATPGGAFAFYTEAGHLFSYSAASHSSTDLTPTGGVKGVLGASEGGSTVYFQDASGLQEWHEGTIATVAAGPEAAQPSDWPPTTGTARVSTDGTELLFLSAEPLTGYDNHDQSTGKPDSEVYLYSSQTGEPLCLSCNPTGERPLGPSTIPGAYANGKGGADVYKPRVLVAGGRRVFFDSEDALAALDTNKRSDVYQWEGQGAGSCTDPGGCLNLISKGTDPVGASFLDASESGEDAYFLTTLSLDQARDPGSADVYDARVGGGIGHPVQEIPCEGDACVQLPPPPEDPTVGTLIPGLSNPPVNFPKTHRCPKGRRFVIRHGHVACVSEHRPRHRRHHGKKRGHR